MRLARLVALLAGLLLLCLATPALAAPTGGSGGPLTDRLNVPYTNSAGVASKGHIFAAGLDWTKPVGMMIYADGSGEYGLANPNSTYLLDADGTAGLRQVAKKRNMILVTPRAPGAGCPDGGGVCWYQTSSGYSPAQKTQWAYDFVQWVRGQYNEDDTRMVDGGYSSGAQLATEYLTPKYGELLNLDLIVAISYGGRPILTPSFSAAFKSHTPVVWDVGSLDPSYTTTSQYGVKAGYNWYTSNGFARTELNVVQGEDHSRSGQFAAIMDREIGQYLP